MRNWRFKASVAALAIAISATIVFVACDGKGSTPTSDKVQASKTETLLLEAERQVGMPDMVNFQQRKLMKYVYELADREDLICFAYIKAEMTGKLIFMGQCMGFGIPFSAQFTNPEKVAHRCNYNGGSFGTLPQADPNGLFMPTSSSATWLLMIDPRTGKQHPTYIEPEIVVSVFPLSLTMGDLVIGNDRQES